MCNICWNSYNNLLTTAWEQRKLDEISLIAKGQQLNKASLKNEGTYYVLNGGMTPSGYTEMFNTMANTISISEGGNSCGYVAYNDQKFWSGGHNYTLSQLKVDVKYLYQNLKNKESFIMSLRVGSGLPNVQKSRLSEVVISYPSNEMEQKEIALFLSTMDSLITLHQRK
ncbi:MAG: restriction endonuclease subunit S, partial [Bacilli bacterium]